MLTKFKNHADTLLAAQYSGRFHRDYEGKQDVIIYDYVDTHIRVLDKMYYKRLRAYKKIGYEIIMNTTEKKRKIPMWISWF